MLLVKILKYLVKFPWFRQVVNKFIIDRFSNSLNPRPRPFSLLGNYSSWKSLTDTSYSGRLLPSREPLREPPPITEVAELWRRRDDLEIPSAETSLLFAYFAQWFTDSFLRTNTNDRRKNASNHEIDFCQLYGANERQTNILRSQFGGKLRSQQIGGVEFPPYLFAENTSQSSWVFSDPVFETLHDPQRLQNILKEVSDAKLRKMFVTGLEHGNSNIGYTALNVVALREHNRICKIVADENPDWDDERIFQVVRNVMIVLLLKIVVEDYVKHISSIKFPFLLVPGFSDVKNWNRSNWVSVEFNLLYRWHSMVPEDLEIPGCPGGVSDFRLNPELLTKVGVGSVLAAASAQRAGKIGLGNTHRMFFSKNFFDVGGDTSFLSVQEVTLEMGRRFGLRSMNEYRRAFGLKRYTSFDELTADPRLTTKLSGMYDNIDDVELLVGLYAEKHKPGAMLGELMTTMVAYEAFTHALTNPLLSGNVYSVETFSKAGIAVIESTSSISSLIARNVEPSLDRKFDFEITNTIPGTHNLRFIRQIWETIDFLYISGWKNYFLKRKLRFKSTVFRVNFFGSRIAVMDHQAFEPLLNWDGSLQKQHGFGWAAPPKILTGGVVPSVFQNERSHSNFKSFYIDLLKSQSDSMASVFENTFRKHACIISENPDMGLSKGMENFAADFAFTWYFGASPVIENVVYVYSNILTHLPLSLAKLIPWSRYNKSIPKSQNLYEFVRHSDGFANHGELAAKHGITDLDTVAHQMLFLVGMNNFLGLQGLSKSLIGELARNPEVVKEMQLEIEGAQEKSGTELSLSELSEQPIIDKFVKETLRLHPPVFFIFGTAVDNFQLNSKSGKFLIEKGEELVGIIPLVQSDDDIFINPEEFRPSRFDDPKLAATLVWPHGRHSDIVKVEGHICPGKDVAVLYAKMLCRALVMDYEWELESPPIWSSRTFSLNVASPKGDLRTKFFRAK